MFVQVLTHWTACPLSPVLCVQAHNCSPSFCPSSSSDLTSANSSAGLNLGYSNGSYGWVYLGADGQRPFRASAVARAAATASLVNPTRSRKELS